MSRLTIDIETRSVADLKKCGAYIYAADPTTSITHVSWKLDDGPIYDWQPRHSAIPPELYEALADRAVTLVAHNTSFERILLSSAAGARIGVPKGLETLARWSCTASRAAQIGLPRDLERACKGAKLLLGKDKAGHALMMKAAGRAPSIH